MIRRIEVHHWRAYDHLDLTLTHPVTFLVAPNGVGKSSLVEAVRWALLGAPADRARGRAVRGGQDSATVTVWVQLNQTRRPDTTERTDTARGPDGAGIEVTAVREVQVRRTLRRNGTSTFAATLDDDTELTEAEYTELLAQAWSANLGLLDAIIFGPSITAKSTGFPIRDHLAAVFGIEPMLQAAREVKQRRDLIATEIRSLRQDLSASSDAIVAAQELVLDLTDQLAQSEHDRDEADELVRARQAVADDAAAWERYRRQAADYHDRARALATEMAAALNGPSEMWLADPHAALTSAQHDAATAVQDQAGAAADARLRAAQAGGALNVLADASDVCPTCLRPISRSEIDAALAAHGHASDTAATDQIEVEHRTAAARAQQATVTRYAERFAQLHAPIEPTSTDPGPQAVEALSEARSRATNLAQAFGALRERLTTARATVTDLQEAESDRQTLTRLARHDLVLEIAYDSLTSVADHYLTERVEPLTSEVAHRWKLLFGNGALQLSTDGQLHLTHPDVELALGDLSGGERATALVITRVMLAAAATRATTLWFDEPLEHLDPTRRTSIAQTLVRAAQSNATEQLVVTTYEEGLARRLQATAPDTVALVYARNTTVPTITAAGVGNGDDTVS